MTRVLITGAGGFTGRYLASELADAGYEVHGTVLHGGTADVAGVTQFHSLDLTDADAVKAVIADVAPDKVAHLAAIAFVEHADVGEMYRTNILGTRNLLAALADVRKQPETVLLASSANIYGNAGGGMLDESVPPAPANDYGVTKVAAENVAALYRNRLPLIVTRPFNYTGVGQSTSVVIPKIVDHARRRAATIELGNLDVERDFSDVRGVTDAYLRLLECPTAIGHTFNVCSGRHYSLRQVITSVEALSGHSMSVEVNPAFVRQNEVHTLYGDNSHLVQAIGPLRMPPLEETLQWMIEA